MSPAEEKVGARLAAAQEIAASVGLKSKEDLYKLYDLIIQEEQRPGAAHAISSLMPGTPLPGGEAFGAQRVPLGFEESVQAAAEVLEQGGGIQGALAALNEQGLILGPGEQEMISSLFPRLEELGPSSEE